MRISSVAHFKYINNKIREDCPRKALVHKRSDAAQLDRFVERKKSETRKERCVSQHFQLGCPLASLW